MAARNFQALYLKAAFSSLEPDAVAYLPLDYLIVYGVSIVPEADELATVVIVLVVLISDSNKTLLEAALVASADGKDIDLEIDQG